MAYDPGAIDAALAAAVGDEPALIAELRFAFSDSAQRALAAMESSDSVESWQAAAWRLKGLAASFGAVKLMTVATEAADGEAFDASMIGKLRRLIDRF